jgi:hypothetical protein
MPTLAGMNGESLRVGSMRMHATISDAGRAAPAVTV